MLSINSVYKYILKESKNEEDRVKEIGEKIWDDLYKIRCLNEK